MADFLALRTGLFLSYHAKYGYETQIWLFASETGDEMLDPKLPNWIVI